MIRPCGAGIETPPTCPRWLPGVRLSAGRSPRRPGTRARTGCRRCRALTGETGRSYAGELPALAAAWLACELDDLTGPGIAIDETAQPIIAFDGSARITGGRRKLLQADEKFYYKWISSG